MPNNSLNGYPAFVNFLIGKRPQYIQFQNTTKLRRSQFIDQIRQNMSDFGSIVPFILVFFPINTHDLFFGRLIISLLAIKFPIVFTRLAAIFLGIFIIGVIFNDIYTAIFGAILNTKEILMVILCICCIDRFINQYVTTTQFAWQMIRFSLKGICKRCIFADT